MFDLLYLSCRLDAIVCSLMWSNLLRTSTTCVLQVAAPRFLHQRLCSSARVRLLTERLLPGPAGALCGWQPAGHLPALRAYRKDATSTVEFPLSPLTVTEIKQFLRSKDMLFQDGYSCLHIQSIFVEASARKDSFSLFIDKTTGQFLCKDTLAEGSWEDLQDCVEVMQTEGQDFLSPHVLLRYSESVEEQEERDRELREVQRIWSSSVPLTDIAEEEVQQIKAMFQVSVRALEHLASQE